MKFPTRVVPAAPRATGVIVDGPYSGGCDENDEYPVWYVAPVDDDGGEAGKHYTCLSYESALRLGQNMARDRRLELILEATKA